MDGFVDLVSVDNLYSEEILRYSAEFGCGERLTGCDVSVIETGSLCGSRIILDIEWLERDGCLVDPLVIGGVGYHVDSCALGMASAAIFGLGCVGADLVEIVMIESKVKKMLHGGDFSFTSFGEWERLFQLRFAIDYPSRHAAILLPFVAARRAFELTVCGRHGD